jgi:lysophospholipase L1-like esterase
MAADTTPVLIGGAANDGSGNASDLLAGRVDDVRIYDRALTAAEVQALYNAATPGNQPPAVSLTSPAPNSSFTAPATIAMAASASDADGTVSRVEFYQGTTKVGEDLAAPFAFSWTSVPAGSYSLTARATDNAGAFTTSAAVSITVTGTAAPRKVMPLGDSITDGFNIPGGYRIELWSKLVDDGVPPNFVGSMMNGPASLGDKEHEGHSGWRTDEIAGSVNSWLAASGPNVILLMIGTNDIYQRRPVSEVSNTLSLLIDQITTQSPDTTLIVASIPPMAATPTDPDINARVNELNSTIPPMVNTKASAGKKVMFVDIYSALQLTDLADGVHPNETGYSKIALRWYDVLRPLLTAP